MADAIKSVEELLDKLEAQISGGLCYFTADAKHEQLRDAQATALSLRKALAEQPAQGEAVVNVVPGVMRCAKCDFRLQRVTLYVRNGAAGAGDNKTEPCPNGCGPLWPVTWEQEARECWKLLEEQHDRLTAPPAPSVPESLIAELEAEANSWWQVKKPTSAARSAATGALTILDKLRHRLAAAPEPSGIPFVGTIVWDHGTEHISGAIPEPPR